MRLRRCCSGPAASRTAGLSAAAPAAAARRRPADSGGGVRVATACKRLHLLLQRSHNVSKRAVVAALARPAARCRHPGPQAAAPGRRQADCVRSCAAARCARCLLGAAGDRGAQMQRTRERQRHRAPRTCRPALTRSRCRAASAARAVSVLRSMASLPPGEGRVERPSARALTGAPPAARGRRAQPDRGRARVRYSCRVRADGKVTVAPARATHLNRSECCSPSVADEGRQQARRSAMSEADDRPPHTAAGGRAGGEAGGCWAAPRSLVTLISRRPLDAPVLG